MKFRTDFVTNSSSSSFTVYVTIESNGKNVTIAENPYDHDPDFGGTAVFDGDLRDINDHLTSVEALATWLANAVWPDKYEKTVTKSLKKKRELFVRQACESIPSVRDIDAITVERHYSAWGEFADLCADSDETLRELARKYLQSSGDEKLRAKAELVTYIQTADDVPAGEFFGTDCERRRYFWDGRNLDKIARRLCGDTGPNRVAGTEQKRLDLKTGEYFDESWFNLS